MKTFKKATLVLIVLMAAFLIYKFILTAEAKSSLSLSEKIDLLITKQEEALNKLDNIYDELNKIKIRVSKKL
jgi:hypothetical protein